MNNLSLWESTECSGLKFFITVFYVCHRLKKELMAGLKQYSIFINAEKSSSLKIEIKIVILI